jgi:hypothetical protein
LICCLVHTICIGCEVSSIVYELIVLLLQGRRTYSLPNSHMDACSDS